MTEIAQKASEEFVRKVKGLLETITGRSFSFIVFPFAGKYVWNTHLDESKVSTIEGIIMNKGIYEVEEGADGVIRICSGKFHDINEVASEEYNYTRNIGDDLLDKKNWGNYRKRLPSLIAELEAIESTVGKSNEKFGSNIKLWAQQKPYLETSFDARGMREDEKLRQLERHARAMYETWKLWREWSDTIGREIYMKTSRMRLSKNELVDDVVSRLYDITKVKFTNGYAILAFGKKKPGIRWVIGGSPNFEENLAANRGTWSVEENEDSIVIKSDNLETINAQSIEEYNLIKWGGITAHKRFSTSIVSPEVIEMITYQVSHEFKADIKVIKDKPVMVTEFKTKGLRPYGKLYEIERHAKALAEAWNRIKELAKGAVDIEA